MREGLIHTKFWLNLFDGGNLKHAIDMDYIGRWDYGIELVIHSERDTLHILVILYFDNGHVGEIIYSYVEALVLLIMCMQFTSRAGLDEKQI